MLTTILEVEVEVVLVLLLVLVLVLVLVLASSTSCIGCHTVLLVVLAQLGACGRERERARRA